MIAGWLRRFGLRHRAADLAVVRAQAAEAFDRGDFPAALARYRQLDARDDAPLLVNTGYCHLMLGDPASAGRCFAEATALDPRLAQAWVGRADVAAAGNDHAQAVLCYDTALSLDAGLAVARNNRSQSLTALGRLGEAWRDAEVRYALANAGTLYPHRIALPRWDGSPSAHVLVHWEQGLGDMVQHLRFLPMLASRCATTAFECPPPLLSLCQRMPGMPRLIPASNAAPDLSGFDSCLPLLSLPCVLNANPQELPPTPYLSVDDGRARAARLAWSPGSAPLLAIAWRASSFDPGRSLSLPDLLRALAWLRKANPAVTLLSVQKDTDPDERAEFARHAVVDAGSSFITLEDTAVALSAADAVLTVDTVIAHLAGALARPVWTLLNEPAATRWMLDRGDSPWYASMRLLRKPGATAWSQWLPDAIAPLGKALAADAPSSEGIDAHAG